MTPLLLVLALVGASPRGTDALWGAAFDLNDPAQAPRAEATLTKAGPAGFDVLMKMARSGGEASAVHAAALDLRCPMGLFGMAMQQQMMMRSRTPEPSQAAARFASKLLTGNPKLRQRMLASPSSFERRIVIAHLAREPQALMAALPRLEREDDPQVLNLLQNVLQCLRFAPPGKEAVDREAVQAAQERFEKRVTALVPQDRCDSPEGITGELRENLKKGSWRVNGWSMSGRELSIHVETDKSMTMRLTPPCALALYDVLEKQGVYLPGLVVPVSTFESVPKPLRQEGARRATRDLERYPEQERNRLAAELVVAGHTVQQPVVLREGGFTSELELEAAVRQKQPGALKALEQHVFCRGADEGTSLLGFVGTPEAAETAWQLGSRCPRAVGGATAALVRMKDPRGLELLGPAFSQYFNIKPLNRAAVEHYTPALGQKLRALKDANLERGGSAHAQQLLELLEAEGLIAPEPGPSEAPKTPPQP